MRWRRTLVISTLVLPPVLLGLHYNLLAYHLRRAEARAQTEARSAGIPLIPSEFPLDVPRPEDNAAPHYAYLGKLFRGLGVQEIPFPSGEPPEAQVLEMNRLFAKRPDITAYVHHAVKKPRFHLPIRFTPSDPCPDMQAARSTVIWLSWEAWMHARYGEPTRAVDTMALGFRVSQHYAEYPYVYSLSTSIGTIGLSLDGMEDLLCTFASDPRMVQRVRTTLDGTKLSVDPAYNLKGEAVVVSGFLRGLPPWAYPSFARLDYFGNGSQRQFGNIRISIPDISCTIRESALAVYLEHLTQSLRALEEPEPDRTVKLALLSRQLHQRQGIRAMENRIVSRYLPSIGTISLGVNQLHARHRVLLASAAVLDYRNRTGDWPARLSDAMDDVPEDPYNPAKPVCYRREGEGFIIEAGTPEAMYDTNGTRVRVSRGAVFSYPDRYAALTTAQRKQIAKGRRSKGPMLKPIKHN